MKEFSSIWLDRTFKSYQYLVKFHVNNPEYNLLFEYKKESELTHDYLPGDPKAPREGADLYCKSHDDYKTYHRNKNYATSFDVAKDKGQGVKRARTIELDSETLSTIDFVRYPQGFDPDVYLSQSSLTLFDFWEKYSAYKQVSAGFTHLHRNVLIVDIDNKDGSMTLAKIYENMSKYNLPVPNYIITHHKPDLDTFQLGFLMDSHLKIRESSKEDTLSIKYCGAVSHAKYYIQLTHSLNSLLDGDTHYSGWQAKNPYYCQNDPEFTVNWFSKSPVSSWADMRDAVHLDLTSCVVGYSKPRSYKVYKSKVKTHAVPKTVNLSNSRNYHLRMFVASEIRRTHAKISLDELMTTCLSKAMDFAVQAGKTEPQSVNEIMAVVRCSYRYFVQTYQANPAPKSPSNKQATKSSAGAKYSAFSRKVAGVKRSLNRFHKCLSVYSLLSQGVPRADVQTQLGIDYSHFYRYNKTLEQIVNEASSLHKEAQSILTYINSLKFSSPTLKSHVVYFQHMVTELSTILQLSTPETSTSPFNAQSVVQSVVSSWAA